MKKTNIYIILICMLIANLICITATTINNKKREKQFEESILTFSEKNEKTIYSINKILFFSSSNAKNKTSTGSNFTIENLYTYTDISIFININPEEQNLENELKNITIKNITYKKSPTIGQPNLYYKSVKDFTSDEIKEENKIKKELKLEVISEETTDLDKQLLYNNVYPITLSYINQNIKTDYTMLDISNPITYDGTLLKKCEIPLNLITTQIAFEIEIENVKGHKFKTTMNFDIPYENDEKSIYDGNIVVKKELKKDFYRYE